uniref:Uncharacterized protein n=1 Tax=Corticoviridae sp. TaxID=2832474 RepID=A0A8D9PDZ5_9VIRU|nr:MAG TPA: hypothetical protein [Corticoviridae sp.]
MKKNIILFAQGCMCCVVMFGAPIASALGWIKG